MISDSAHPILDVASAAGTGRASAQPQLAAHLGTQLVMGHMDVGGRRISDVLNDNTVSHVVMGEACTRDLGAAADRPVEGGILSVRKDALDFVVPWDNLDIYRPRVGTQPVATEVTTRFFRVRGGVSRRATDPTNLPQLLAGFSRRFIPVVDATIESLLDPEYQLSAPIVLINTGQIQSWSSLSDV